LILHFCSRDEWAAAQTVGWHEAPSLGTEGFIHCSTTETVLLPANGVGRGRTDLVLLEIDEDRMLANLDLSNGLIMAKSLMTALAPVIWRQCAGLTASFVRSAAS
jgi:uncharacterized protein (DUF952 family)